MARVRAVVAIEVEQCGHRCVVPCGSIFELGEEEARELLSLEPPPIELLDPPPAEPEPAPEPATQHAPEPAGEVSEPT